MNGFTASPSIPATKVISDPQTLCRTLLEVHQLLEQTTKESPCRPSLLQVHVRVVWLLLNLCSAQLKSRDWVFLHSQSMHLKRLLQENQGR